MRFSPNHGSYFTITRTMSNEFPVENSLSVTGFCLLVCGIRLWKPRISPLTALTCRSKRKRAYFQTYMKLPPNSIAQALLELYSSSLGQPDYKILVAFASGMVAMRSQVWTRCA
jgi:hypothetical protein